VERIAAPLRVMGARVATQDGKPPLVIEGAALRGIEWRSPVASAQVKTAVLLAGLQAEGRTVVREPRASRDHTERLLPLFGVPLERDGLTVSVTGGARLSPARAVVPGDASTAAFLVVAALIVPGSAIRIDNLLLNPTRTGFIEVLKAMGADITTGIESETPEPVGWLEARSSQLEGVPITAELVPSLIDELPVLAVAGACAKGRLEISGAAELRVKESDRIAAVAEGLTALGAHVSERPDGLVVDGGHPLEGSRVRSLGDHRIAMAMAVAGLVAAGETQLEGAECAAVSCPEFFELLKRGARG
jgi:3-phosphoshikimate 1-carboxyvinyltransferase